MPLDEHFLQEMTERRARKARRANEVPQEADPIRPLQGETGTAEGSHAIFYDITDEKIPGLSPPWLL